ncbi:HEPN domain-containing protein [Algoriphagus sp. C2-6-M1]|uniref:HEPN domain-containing protein n=1 Tax=Algoriphagus persicinus TaxID=3108754 RepID=UPI002B3D9A9C|nr:HEPN domain-containing protein [Algoriphagus sp. C2-6-M1]MEB2780752.1 HEPN domain-containing protein [Algoriphagus sp. C2-6-M1]
MLQFETDHAPDDLFNLFPKNELHEYLWEMLQGWMIFLTQREKDDMDIATRMYFYELLSHLLSHQYQKRQKEKEQPTISRMDALCCAFIELLHPLAVYEHEVATIHHWYLLLPHLSPNEHDELEKVVEFLASANEGHQVHCISGSYLKKSLTEGNPYLWKEVFPSQAKYLSSNFEELPTLSPEDRKQIFTKAAERLKSGLDKAKEFQSLTEQAKREMAPFLLHQSAEMALRAILMAWEKLEKKTHEIRVLLRFASKYNPELGSIFSPEEEKLLKLLDKCYANSRYHAGFKVPEKLLPILECKVNSIIDLATSEYTKLITLAG